MGDFENKFPASACRKKKIAFSSKCNRKLMEKKGKKYPAHQIARKKILDDQKSPTPPLKSYMVGPLTRLWHFLREFSEILRLFSDHEPSILRLANQIEERLSAVFEFCSRQNTTRNNFLYPKNWEWRTFPLSISKTMFDLLLDVIWRLLESKYRSWKDRKFK